MDDGSTLGPRPGAADRGALGDQAPCWHGAPQRSVRPYSDHMYWARRAVIACAALVGLHLLVAGCFLAAAPNRTSWLTLVVGTAIVPATTGLSVLVARRREGGVVGVLLGLLSLAVAQVAVKEIWLLWLAKTGESGRWAWLVAVTAENGWWMLVDVRPAAAVLPGRPAAGSALALGPADAGRLRGRQPGRQRVRGRAVPGAAAGPAPPVRPAAGCGERSRLVAFVLMLVLVVACAASLGGPLPPGRRRPRAQIKWLALAGIGIPLYPLLCLLEILVWGRPLWFSAAVGIAGLVGDPGGGRRSRCCATTCTTSTRRWRRRHLGRW